MKRFTSDKWSLLLFKVRRACFDHAAVLLRACAVFAGFLALPLLAQAQAFGGGGAADSTYSCQSQQGPQFFGFINDYLRNLHVHTLTSDAVDQYYAQRNSELLRSTGQSMGAPPKGTIIYSTPSQSWLEYYWGNTWISTASNYGFINPGGVVNKLLQNPYLAGLVATPTAHFAGVGCVERKIIGAPFVDHGILYRSVAVYRYYTLLETM